MNTPQFARQQIALSILTIGFGLLLLYFPAILGFLVIGRWAPLLWVLMFPLGFYVIGRGIAGVVEGITRMVRAISEER